MQSSEMKRQVKSGGRQFVPLLYFKPVTNYHGVKYSRTAESILTKNTISTKIFSTLKYKCQFLFDTTSK